MGIELEKDFQTNLEGLYKNLFESAGEGLVVSDSKGKVLLANPSAIKMFGYSGKDEFEGIGIEDLVPDNLKEKHKSHRANFVKNPAKRTMGEGLYLFAKRKDESEFPVEISLNYFTKDGHFFVMAMITDITKKWKIDQLLKKEKASTQLYFDIANALFIVLDKNKKIDLLNRKTESLLGVKTDAIRGKDWFEEFVFEDDVKSSLEQFIELTKSKSQKTESEFECRVHSKKGGIRLISWKCIGIRTDDNTINKILLSGQDITDQRQAEEKIKNYTIELEEKVKDRTKELSSIVNQLEKANVQLESQNKKIKKAQDLLQKSQELYKIIARNFPKGTISVFDKDLNYIFVEGKELYELGVTSEMLIGTNLRDRLNDEVRERTIKELTEVFGGIVKKIEIKSRENYYLLTGVPLRDYDDSISQIMVVEQNITESKMVEENMKKALEKERDLGELKTRFVSMASHEFRTPLSTILSSTSLIQKYLELGDTEKTNKHIDRIKSSIKNLTNILNDFLSLGKLEEGKISVNPEDTDVIKFFEEIIEEMQGQAKKGQKIKLNVEKSPKTSYLVDKSILRNICNNLISNAIKYSPENLEIDINFKGKNGSFYFNVIDYGMGIPKDEKKYMFDRFFRAKNVSNIQGTGLGLNIVKKYVDLLNGEISFESEEGKGTKFSVMIKSK